MKPVYWLPPHRCCKIQILKWCRNGDAEKRVFNCRQIPRQQSDSFKGVQSILYHYKTAAQHKVFLWLQWTMNNIAEMLNFI